MSSLPLASDNDNAVFLAGTSSNLTAISLLSGRLLWSVDLAGRLISSPVLDYGSVRLLFRIPSDSGNVSTLRSSVLGIESGIASASGSYSFPAPARIGADSLGSIYKFQTPIRVAAAESGHAILDNAGSLALIGAAGEAWRTTDVPAEAIGLSSDSRWLLVWNSKGEASLIDASSGEVSTRLSSGSVFSGAFAVGKSRIYVGTADGFVIAFGKKEGRLLWKSRTGGRIDGILGMKDGPIVSSRDNFVYKLADGNGRKIWKRKLAGRIIGSTLLGNSFAAYLAFGTNEVFILRLRDGSLANAFPLNGSKYFVSAPMSVKEQILIPTDHALVSISEKGHCPKQERDGDTPSLR